MQRSDDGYVPARGFLERCMAPRPEFNDGTEVDPVSVDVDDGMLCYLSIPTGQNDKCWKFGIPSLDTVQSSFFFMVLTT